MGCLSCSGGATGRSTDKWIYQSKEGKRYEYNTKNEADIQVTKNGGGTVYRKV